MKKYSIFIVSIILCILFWRLSSNYSDYFNKVEESYREGTAINLTKGITQEEISKLLFLHNYVDNKEDAAFIAQQLVEKLNKDEKLSSLYALNKRIWQVSSNIIDNIGSDGFKEKLATSQEALGIDNVFKSIDVASLDSGINLDNENFGKIVVTVIPLKDTTISHPNKQICPHTVVRLSEHFLDSLKNNRSESRIVCYLKTGTDGKVVFKGLNPNLSYSVLPIRQGYEYGPSQGTIGGTLLKCNKSGELSFNFTEKKHTVRLFDESTLKQMKEDRSLTIRSPKEFKNLFTTYLVLFFAVWWGLYLLWLYKHKNSDSSIVSILMFLTGLCVLIMFSINDPLRDPLLGVHMVQGVIAGVIIIGLLQYVDFTKFYQNKSKLGFDIPLEFVKWLFKPYHRKVEYLTQILSNKRCNVFQKCIVLLVLILSLPLLLLDFIRITKLGNRIDELTIKLPKGCGYLLTALLLTALLFPFGSEIGGMKVNFKLPGNITFQPSEIAKYLIVFFMAAFFSRNADRIIKYSKKGNAGLFGHKLKMLSAIIIGLGLLMGLYVCLGDMGPALVLAFTFIILYSVVKSKVDLENLDERGQNIKILTCDLAMLIYGFISFAAFLYIGNVIDYMGIFCLGWFILWIMLGVARKQIFESAILFNFIIAFFIFGGNLLSHIPISKFNSIVERLESRNEMCLNTWGTLPIDGMVAKAGENTQIAEGLWGLASGSIWGQGLGDGSSHFIPAFYTDMIMESIGEQLGFIGIFVVLFLLSLLLRKTVLIGYRTSHPFAFYLCLGIAIVTAIQFAIISLGSTGIIPLTGVTVPFLSYGGVSMILNLAAFGIILSYTPIIVTNEAKAHLTSEKNIGKYNYSISVLSWLYCALAVSIGSVFFYYQFINRNDILVRPVYVNNANGVPVVEYNPRIKPLVNKMWAGDIYDRNSILLATSDSSKITDYYKYYNDSLRLNYHILKSQQRYYPFGEHLFFMLGDYNTKQFFSSHERFPRGYLAEFRHLAELRGYDDVLRNTKGEPIKVDLKSDEYRPGKYHSSEYSITQKGVQLRDYSALVPYLKAGLNSDKVRRLNNRKSKFWEFDKITSKDIQLTIDVNLQIKLQQRMIEYMKKKYSDSKWNKCRVSVVVLDAKEGDLLASANYPLPNYNQLKNAPDIYSDNRKDINWKAYTDMDLGLTYFTPPGSTAKVMSALAGFCKEGKEITSQKYNIDKHEIIYSKERSGMLDMKHALRYSSNCYFIHLINDKWLYHELANIYGNVGVQVFDDKSYIINHSVPGNKWKKNVTTQGEKGIDAYIAYKKSGKKEKMNLCTKPEVWSWAWGQRGINATPITMARVVSIVVNGGKMPVTKYLLKTGPKEIEIVPSCAADSLINFLKFTAKEHDKFNISTLGGKTGTPERTSNGKKTSNDGWYVCFIENTNIASTEHNKKTTSHHPLAIAVRMERINDGMSGKAVDFTKNVVINILKELGYIN